MDTMKKSVSQCVIIMVSVMVWAGTALADDGMISPAGSLAGVYRTYRFTYQDENTTTLFPKRMGQAGGSANTFMSTLAFDGDLRVKDYGTLGDQKIYSLSFDQVRSNHFALNGHDVFDDPSLFIGQYKKSEIYVALDRQNEISRFYYPGDTSQAFKTFMTTVAEEIQVSVRQGKNSWSTEEINQHGRGIVDYAVTGNKGKSLELSKTRKNYDYPGLIEPGDRQDIQGKDKLILDDKGFLQDIDKREETTITSQDGKETILQVKKTLQLRRTDQGTFDPGDFGEGHLAAMQAAYPGESIPDKGQDRELLAKQAAYLSYDDIESWIGGFTPDEKNNRANNSMFYRSVGFVSLQPQSTVKLAEYCITKADRSQAKTLVMNLLAAVGSPEAQGAMREILSDPGIQKERQYGMMIQNFSFMDTKPEPETIEFLDKLIQSKTNYVSYAGAHAYGSCIHKLYAGQEQKKALALNRILLDKIKASSTPDEKSEYIAALGNAGMMENNSLLFECFGDDSPKIRSEAVMALRKTETPQVRMRVLTLFPDSERGVQRSAIQTFIHFSPEEQDIREMRNQLDTGRIEEANFYDMTSLLKKNITRYPALVRDCLKLMVRKKLKDPDLEARIRGMI